MPAPLIVLAAVAGLAASPAPITVCNGMKVDLAGIALDESALSAAGAVLHPGDCLTTPAPTPGDHSLRFIEQAGPNVAQCVRKVAAAPGDRIDITPDDGSSCMQ